MTHQASNLELQLKGYRLTTAEIIYHLPDHPGVLQSFIWQQLDLAPDFPELQRFLDFWQDKIEGPLHTVTVANRQIIGPSTVTYAKGMWRLH